MNVLTTHDLSKRYGGTVALERIDLTLSTGVTGLLGPNGAGKTTLIRLLTTATPPSSGQITVLGHEATGSSAERTEVRRQLGYLPQEVSFPRGMTCFAFIDYIAVLKEWTDTGLRHAEVRRVLDLVGLGDRTTKRIRKPLGRAASPARPGPVVHRTAAAARPRRTDHRSRPRAAGPAAGVVVRARSRRRGAARDAPDRGRRRVV